jgi:hypothetical protein
MSKEAKYTELYSRKNQLVDTLFKIYQKNKFNARVYYMNENHQTFYTERVGVFDEPNGDFNIVYFKRTFGISKTNIIYNRESKVFSIIKKGNKFYFKNKSSIKPLTYQHVLNCQHFDVIKGALVSRLPWLRYITENSIIESVSFNTIYSKKIFSLEKALKYEYKLPAPSAKLLHNIKLSNTYSYQAKFIRYYVEYLDNVENLHNTLPTYDFSIFYDTLKMAKILNRKINCSWSVRRLKEEHDNWSKEITDIVFTEGDRNLNLSDIYIKFAEFSGFKLLQTTKEMNIEGRKQSHCVATYVSKVDSGSCGIYSIKDYTLELVREWVNTYTQQVLVISQFRGYKNCEAPEELVNIVKDKLSSFNGLNYDNMKYERNNILNDNILPF